MSNIDLSDYAGLFIFGLISACALLSYINYKIDGSGSAGATALLSIVGMWISLGIVKLADFDDATPETVITISVVTLILPLIYSLVEIRGWASKRKTQAIKSRIHDLQKDLNSIESKLNYECKILNLISLFEQCNVDVRCIEQHPKLSSQKMLITKAESIKKTIAELSSQIQSGG